MLNYEDWALDICQAKEKEPGLSGLCALLYFSFI